jgi:hypothetical protein
MTALNEKRSSAFAGIEGRISVLMHGSRQWSVAAPTAPNEAKVSDAAHF